MAGEYIFIWNNVNNTKLRRVQCLQFFDVNHILITRVVFPVVSYQIPLKLIGKDKTIIFKVEINTNISTVDNTRSASSSVTPRYSWKISKVCVKHQSINQSSFVRKKMGY